MTPSVGGAHGADHVQIPWKTLLQAAARLGMKQQDDAIVMPFFHYFYRITHDAVEPLDGAPSNDAVAGVMRRYMERLPHRIPSPGRCITFRELPGAGPLVSSFATNTNKLIESTFGDDPEKLVSAGLRLGGRRCSDAPGYDVSLTFEALPAIPVYLQFNAREGTFPAQSTLLFDQSAVNHLDMHALFTIGTFLAGRIIG